MRRNIRVNIALVGLLVLSASSLTTASGRKPAGGVDVTLRRISASEVMAILQKFPEMVPSYLTSVKDSVGMLAQLFPLSEVTAAPLKRAFPTARFYKGLNLGIKPPVPYMMAVFGDKRYPMYGGFNLLLVDNGLKVTDESILALAEAFVILALGSDRVLGDPAFRGPEAELLAFRQVTFLDAQRIAQVRGGISYDAKLKVRIGDQVEEWYFDSYFDEFRVVSRGNEQGLILQYHPTYAEPLPQRGLLDPKPKIDVDTIYPSHAQVEWEDTIPHYYIVVESNNCPTGLQVTFSLSDFPANAPNVYVRVQDTVRNTIRLLDTVHIDSQGNGTETWKPPVESTGICVVGAGFADTLDSFGTYRDATGRQVMALHPGPNDVRALAPGVYFVLEAQAQAQAQAVRKVVLTE